MYREPIYITTEKDAVHWRVEFQQVVETTYLKLPDTVEKWIVPIAAEKENTTQWIETENGNVRLFSIMIKVFTIIVLEVWGGIILSYVMEDDTSSK